MTMRQGLIVFASLMMAGPAYAEQVPSNAELFQMLKEQQRIISELRAELKQTRMEQRAADKSQRREVDTASKKTGDESSKEAVVATTPTQTYTMYKDEYTALPSRGAYVGLFGGRVGGSSSSASQRGTAFIPEAGGGPLAVNATGQSKAGGVGFVGAQFGYEWSYHSFLLPAVEVEGLHLGSTQQRATLVNPTTRLVEQTFDDTFPTSTTVVLANAVVGVRTPYQSITPYFGGGIGAARISINGGTSTQINPAEVGINHFNTGPDSSFWTFAAQAKAGVRIALGKNAYVFGEYRYLFIGSHDHIFGSTDYPTHTATSPWTVNFGKTSYNMFDAGVGLNF